MDGVDSRNDIYDNGVTASGTPTFGSPRGRPEPEVNLKANLKAMPAMTRSSYLSSDSSDDEEIVFDANELLQIHDWFKNKMNAPQYSQQDRPLSYFSDDSSSDDQDEEPTPWETIERCFKNIDDQMDYVYTCIAQDDWEEQGLFTLPDDVAERLNGYSQDF